jgi:hypothetical protein
MSVLVRLIGGSRPGTGCSRVGEGFEPAVVRVRWQGSSV